MLSVKPLELWFGLIFFGVIQTMGISRLLLYLGLFLFLVPSPSAVLPFNKKCSRFGEFLVHPKASAGPGPQATPGVSCSFHNPTTTS